MAMKGPGQTHDSDRIAEEALGWYVRLTSGDALEQDFAAHAEWLAVDPAHLEAFDEIQRLSDALAPAAGSARLRFAADLAEASRVIPLPVRAAPHRTVPRRWIVLPAAVAAALALFFVAPQFRQAAPSVQMYETADRGTRQFTLQDGSTVALDIDSSLVVTYSEGRREARLIKGAALFDVVHKPDRPFSVAAAGHVVTVLGTKFEVAARDQSLAVAVARGAVSVADDSGGQVLREGEKVTYGAGGGAVRKAVDERDVGSWTSGRLVFDHEPLARVIARLNHYVSGGQLQVTDHKLAERPFSGILVVSDAHTTAMRLAGLMQLTYTNDGNLITLAPR